MVGYRCFYAFTAMRSPKCVGNLPDALAKRTTCDSSADDGMPCSLSWTLLAKHGVAASPEDGRSTDIMLVGSRTRYCAVQSQLSCKGPSPDRPRLSCTPCYRRLMLFGPQNHRRAEYPSRQATRANDTTYSLPVPCTGQRSPARQVAPAYESYPHERRSSYVSNVGG